MMMRRSWKIRSCVAVLMLLCVTLLPSMASTRELTDRQRAELILAMDEALKQCEGNLATCRSSTREVVREVIREIPAECPPPPELPPLPSPWPDRLLGAGAGAGLGALATLLALLALR